LSKHHVIIYKKEYLVHVSHEHTCFKTVLNTLRLHPLLSIIALLFILRYPKYMLLDKINLCITMIYQILHNHLDKS